MILAQVKEEEDLIRACKDADALLNQYVSLTRRVLENLPKCKVIARYGPPHVGFYSEESIHELKRRAAEIASTVLLGKWPKSVVNPEVMGKTRASISKPLEG